MPGMVCQSRETIKQQASIRNRKKRNTVCLLFSEDKNNSFAILMISYGDQGSKVLTSNATFVPTELLGWNCLIIGAQVPKFVNNNVGLLYHGQ